jgi:hypothetical protein
VPVLLHWAVAAVQALDLRVAVGTEEVDFLQEAGSPAKVASADRVAVQAGPTVPVAAGNQAAGPGLVEAGHDRAVAEGRELGARRTEHLAAGHILAALDSAAEDQPEEAEGMAFQAVEGTVREVEDIGHAEADTAPEEGNPVHRAEDILEVALGSQAGRTRVNVFPNLNLTFTTHRRIRLPIRRGSVWWPGPTRRWHSGWIPRRDGVHGSVCGRGRGYWNWRRCRCCRQRWWCRSRSAWRSAFVLLAASILVVIIICTGQKENNRVNNQEM